MRHDQAGVVAAVLALVAVSSTGLGVQDFPDDLPVVKRAMEVRLPETFCPYVDPPKMAPPVTSLVDPKTVEVKWEALGSEFAVGMYKLQMSVDGMDWDTVFSGAGSLSFTLSPYSNTVEYRFRVKGINCASGGFWSDITRLAPLTVVDRPRTPTASDVTSSSLVLHWAPCVDNPHSMSLVQFRRAPAAPSTRDMHAAAYDDWEEVLYDFSTDVRVHDLLPGRHYWFRLAYVDGENTHVWSKILSVRTIPLPPSPPATPLFRWTNSDQQQGRVQWTAPDDTGGADIVRYSLEAQTDNDDDFQLVFSGLADELIVTLQPGRLVTLRLNATNEAGTSDYSNPLYVDVPPTVPGAPDAVRLLRAQAYGMTVQWAPPVNDGGAEVTSYVLMRGDGLALPYHVEWEGNAWTHEAEALHKRTHYRWRVAGVNVAGVGAFSQEVVFSTQHVDYLCPGGMGDGCFLHGKCNTDNMTCVCDEGSRWTLEDCTGLKCHESCRDPFGECDFTVGLCVCTDDHQLRERCDLRPPAPPCPNNCSGVGECTAATGVCVCPKDDMLADCSYDCSARHDCPHGQCVGTNTCECDDGWEGEDCATPQCFASDGCSGHGTCIAPEECQCNLPWTGADCSEPMCPDACMGRGTCVGVGQCECNEGFSGSSCEFVMCKGGCSGHGLCVAPMTCDCFKGWVGEDCSLPLCTEVNECNGRGTCVAPQLCNCTVEGWGGDGCNTPVCQDDCSGNGRCIAPLRCDCDSGWSGESCAVARCDEVDGCNGRGNCSRPNVCSCLEGWGGVTCADALCDEVAYCSLHGTCVGPQTCECDYGYSTANCSIRTLPTNSLYMVDAFEKVVLTSPVLSGVSRATVEGWFAIHGTGTRVNLFVQEKVVELYVTRLYPPNATPPMKVPNVFPNALVVHGTVFTGSHAAPTRHALNATVTASEKQPHHIALTIDTLARELKLWVDGAVVDARLMDAALPVVSSSAAVTSGGGSPDPLASEQPSVKVHSLRVWNAPLPSSRLASLVRSSLTDFDADADNDAVATVSRQQSASLLLWWKFTETHGGVVGDHSGSGHGYDGTIVGEPMWGVMAPPNPKVPSPPIHIDRESTGSNTATLGFEAPLSDGGACVTNYDVELFPRDDAKSTKSCWELGWGNGDGAVCAAAPEPCAPPQSFFAADAMCRAKGARLCTVGEVEGGVGEGAQCNAASSRVWTRTTCDGSPNKVYTLSGSTGAKSAVPKLCTTLSPSTTHTALCCADHAPRVFSNSSCAQLVDGQQSGAVVWAQGEGAAAMVCAGANRFSCGGRTEAEATDMCGFFGARLCTRKELQHLGSRVVCEANAGDRVWTGEWCAEGAGRGKYRTTTSADGSAPLRCANFETTASAVCCGDSFPQPCSHTPHRHCALSQLPSSSSHPRSVRVRARNAVGAGEFSEWVGAGSGAVASPVMRSSPVVVGRSVRSVSVAWEVATSNGAPVTSYSVTVRDSRTPTSVLIVKEVVPPLRRATVFGLLPGKSYHIAVAAKNEVGWGAYSAPTTATTAPDLPPPVKIQSAVATAHNATLTWAMPSHFNGKSVDSVVVLRATTHTLASFTSAQPYPREAVAAAAAAVGDVEVHRGPPDELSFTDLDLLPATSYRYTVQAISDVGVSGGASVSVTSLSDVPSAPSSLVASSVGATSAVVSWSAGKDGGCRVERFVVEMVAASAPGTVAASCESTSTHCTVEELTPGTTYTARTTAQNCKGWSVPSDSLPITTPPSAPASPPAPFLRRAGAHGLSVQWGTPDANGDAAMEYFLERSDGGGPFRECYQGTNSSVVLTGLKAGTAYTFRVSASNSIGTSPPSPPSAPLSTSLSPPLAPPAPALVSSSPSTLSVSWELPPSPALPVLFAALSLARGPTCTDFREVYRGDADTTHHTLTMLDSATQYCVRVRLGNAEGVSVPGEAAFVTDEGVPARMLPPRLSQNDDKTDFQIGVQWDSAPLRPSSSGLAPPLVSFDLEMRAVPSPDFQLISTGSLATSFTAASLMPAQTYEFRVRALNSIGAGEFSVPASFTTLASGNLPPPVPDTPYGMVVVEKSATSVALSWEGNDDVEGDVVFVVVRTQGVPTHAALDSAHLPADGSLAAEPATTRDPRYDRPGAGARGSVTEVYRGLENHAVLRGLKPGFSYGVRVGAEGTGSAVKPAPSVFVRVDTAPSVPATPNAAVLSRRSASQLCVEWQAVLDGGSAVEGFEVRVVGEGEDANGAVAWVEGGALNYTVKQRTPSAAYSFSVRARNSVGFSEWSETATFRTLPAPPAAPPRAMAQQTTTATRLVWTAPAEFGSPVTGYIVEMANHGSALASSNTPFALLTTTPASTRSATLPSLVSGHVYDLRVVAMSAVGESTASQVVRVNAPPTKPAPPAVPHLAGRSYSHLSVWWEGGEDGGYPITSFSATLLSTATSPPTTVATYQGAATTATFSNLSPGASYQVVVTAANKLGTSDNSAALEVVLESACVAQDGSLCSGHGRCEHHRCACGAGFAGTWCERPHALGVCALWGGGHLLPFATARAAYAGSGAAVTLSQRAVGRHVLTELGRRGDGQPEGALVTVSVDLAPLDLQRGNATAVGGVVVTHTTADGKQVSHLALRARGSEHHAVDVVADCREGDVSQQAINGQEHGIRRGVFSVRRDYYGRWVVRVQGTDARVVVVPQFLASSRKVVLGVLAVGRVGGTEWGLCGVQAGDSVGGVVVDRYHHQGPEHALPLECGENQAPPSSYVMPTSPASTTTFSHAELANTLVLSMLETASTTTTTTTTTTASSSSSSSPVRPPQPRLARSRQAARPATTNDGALQPALVQGDVAVGDGAGAGTRGCASAQAHDEAASECGGTVNTVGFGPCVMDVCEFPEEDEGLAALHSAMAVALSAVVHHADAIEEAARAENPAVNEALLDRADVIACAP